MKATKITVRPSTKQGTLPKDQVKAKTESDSGVVSLLNSPRDKQIIQGDLVLSKARVFNVFNEVDPEMTHNDLIKGDLGFQSTFG